MTYERRLADVGWVHGTLVQKPVERPPQTSVPIEDRRELLDQARDIVDAVAPDLIEERRRELDEQARRDGRGWRFWRR